VIYCGIDPGKSGGIAWLDGDVVCMTPMPDTELDVWKEFDAMTESDVVYAVIEKVHSMPSQSAQSGFTFGQNYGFLRGMLVGNECIKFQEVGPRTWMAALNIRSRKKTEAKGVWKSYLLQCAENLFPDAPWPSTKGGKLAVCDALLIAEYSRRYYGGKV